MESDTSLVPRVVRDSLSALADHTRVFRELGGQLALVREQFVAALAVNLERETNLARLGGAIELSEGVTRVLVDPLSEKDFGNYLAGIALWSETWRARGANFADSLSLMGILRRTLVPFLLRDYAAGPDLELVFRALDALERANLNVLAAAEITSLTSQLTRGAH